LPGDENVRLFLILCIKFRQLLNNFFGVGESDEPEHLAASFGDSSKGLENSRPGGCDIVDDYQPALTLRLEMHAAMQVRKPLLGAQGTLVGCVTHELEPATNG
jgi:hypothetical protein